MKKKFNITGNCYAEKHYMMDNSAKIDKVYELVEEGKYFVINRPRQYGKTTTLMAVEKKLFESTAYFPIRLNFQGIDQKYYESDSAFAKMIVQELAKYLKFNYLELHKFLKERISEVQDMNSLSELITELVHFAPRKLVLLIDEVDASSNYMPFLSFLGMLRTKYLARETPQDFTFHSVVLVGVHDVRSLKFKIRNPEEAQFNSPWNIAIDFEANMEFSAKEIAPMLQEYSQAEKVEMDIEEISEKLYEKTSGYPFLVSRLCQIVAEKVLPQKKENQNQWELVDLEKAFQLILNEVNTNFESLIKNLENHQDLYDLVFAMLINGQNFMFNIDNATIRKGVVYGVFKQNGKLKIHNRIYEQRIYNYLISNIEVNQENDFYDSENQFLLPNQSLDFKRVLQRFQAYMKENYSTKEQHFWEKQWRLIFLAFLRPILNGKGHDFREVEISDEKRLDVLITYGKFKYIVELKIWRGQDYHERGLAQLSNYLDRQDMNVGYLVIFDQRREMIWKEEQSELEGKKIFAVWV